jgi:hypothetical protein
LKVIELLFVTMLWSLFGVVENVASGITQIIECMYILYSIEMIMLTTEKTRVWLTREFENTSEAVRNGNKKVAC